MANPLAVYVEVRRGIFAQLVAKFFLLAFKLFQKPTANTELIHFSRVVLVPESLSNKRPGGLFRRTKGAMLITTFDNGMTPYFMAFYQDKTIMKHFQMMSLFAVKEQKLPRHTGNTYIDYNNFETWLANANIITPQFYSAYPTTLAQIYQKWPDQNPMADLPVD
jgi:hypothetical protein